MTSTFNAKARQAAKMREIGEALVAAGYDSLDAQAAALGLPRSTTWTIIKATHKSSGLSGATLKRVLSAPGLHPLVRRKILEYIEEKNNGRYGTTKHCLRRFNQRLGGGSIKLQLVDPVQSAEQSRFDKSTMVDDRPLKLARAGR